MRIRVGYSPWEGWDCWIVMPAPWWAVRALSWLDAMAARLESWPQAHALFWRPRRALMAYCIRSNPTVWWEYRAA